MYATYTTEVLESNKADSVGIHATYTTEVFVQELHVSVDHLECQQLIVRLFDTATEVEASVPARCPQRA